MATGSPGHDRIVKVRNGGFGSALEVTFVPAGARVRLECRKAADAVRYPVPCPTLLPQGLTPFPPLHGCEIEIVTAGREDGCGAATSWNEWVVGAGQVQRSGLLGQHLGLQAAPRVVVDPARAIDGPAMFPGSRVQPRGTVDVAGRPTHWYYVPPAANQGSAFAGHLVLVWNAYGHTYAYGFHVLYTMSLARALDLELVRHLAVVYPDR